MHACTNIRCDGYCRKFFGTKWGWAREEESTAPQGEDGRRSAKILFWTRLSRNSLSRPNVPLRDLRSFVLFGCIRLYFIFSTHIFSSVLCVRHSRSEIKFTRIERQLMGSALFLPVGVADMSSILLFNGCLFCNKKNMWSRAFVLFCR